MSWFFKKPKVVEPKVCRHKWKDFPWYYEAAYYQNYNQFKASIIEPYICIHCKERKNVILCERNDSCSLEKAREIIDSWKQKYKDQMLDKVLVEDMIADMQLVDREYLAIAEALANPPKSDLEIEMEQLVKTIKAGSLNPDYKPAASVKTATT